jgi:hypothetical protein
MQITVPVGGSNVIPEGEGPSRNAPDVPSPLAQRKSLHTVRLAAPTAPEYKPEWKENGQLRWVPKEPAAEEPAAEEQVVESTVPRGNGLSDNGAQQTQPYDALHREIAELKQAMQAMAQGQVQPQQPQGPQPPDPTDFDFYDPAQVKEFHRLNNEYTQWTVEQSVQAALAPHRNAMQSAEYTRQYNSVLGDHGWLADGSENPHFKSLMEKALKLVMESGATISIPDAYDRVELETYRSSKTSPQTTAPSQSVKPGQRSLNAQEAAQKAAQARSLPPRNGVSGAAEAGLPVALMNVNALGRIMLHNQQTGRARPI